MKYKMSELRAKITEHESAIGELQVILRLSREDCQFWRNKFDEAYREGMAYGLKRGEMQRKELIGTADRYLEELSKLRTLYAVALVRLTGMEDDSHLPRTDGVIDGKAMEHAPLLPPGYGTDSDVTHNSVTGGKHTDALPFPSIPATARADFEEESQALAKPLPHSPFPFKITVDPNVPSGSFAILNSREVAVHDAATRKELEDEAADA